MLVKRKSWYTGYVIHLAVRIESTFMPRLAVILALLLLPLAAVAQSLDDSAGAPPWLRVVPLGQVAEAGSGLGVPLWRGADGQALVLDVGRDASNPSEQPRAPLSLRALDPTTVYAAGLQYSLTSNLRAQAEVTQGRSINQPSLLTGTELGASYDLGPYRVGLSVGANNASKQNLALPRILPGIAPGVDGLSSFDSDMHVRARGRLKLGNHTGIDLGASTGRIQLLPGNLLGVNTLDQSTLSFGVDHGPLSGALIERTIQPQAGIPGNFNGATKRWSSIDLGVTWRLPWRGELSVGAQNLWSSGPAANTPIGPEPDQSRTPYVQYHQDLHR